MCGVLDVDAVLTGKLTLGYREAVALADSPLGPAGTRAHGHEFHRTAIRDDVAATGSRAANAWRWQARDAVVTEGFIQGGVHASYLHTHWIGIPGASDRLVAAARAYRGRNGGDGRSGT
jgi:cobyrinic acid a,c-diamide synthase